MTPSQHPLCGAGFVAAVLLTFGSTTTAAAEAKPPDAVQRLAKHAATVMDHWELEHVDATPSVAVGEDRGYRIVLRRRYKVYDLSNAQQAQQPSAEEASFEWRHEDWEIVAVPLGEGATPGNVALSADLAERVDRIDFQPRDTDVHLRRVFLGTTLGTTDGCYALYTLAELFNQEGLREGMGLRGGDDRIQLVVEGLSVEDKGSHTANSMSFILPKFGDAALPYLNRAVAEADDPRRLILAIGAIPTERATERLVELYRAGEQEQEAAATALCFGYYREAAKPVYLDLLATKRRTRVRYAAEAAVTFGWDEAVPLLKQVLADPPSLLDYYPAFEAYRRMRDDPIPEAIRRAEHQIKRAGYGSGKPVDHAAIQQGIETIVHSDDVPAAIVTGLKLALYVTKGDVEAVNAAGVQVLRQLPEDQVHRTLDSLAEYLDTDADRRSVKNLLTKIE